MLRCHKRTELGCQLEQVILEKQTNVPKFMVITTIESELGGANRHQNSIGNVSSLASCQVREAGSGHCGESSKHPRKFRVGTLSVNTERKSL